MFQRFPNTRDTVRNAAKVLGVKVDLDRVDVCTAGIELGVVKDEDIVFILRDAKTEIEASRYLRGLIKERL